MLRGYRAFILALVLILSSTNHAYAERSQQKQTTQQSIDQSEKNIEATLNQQAERAQSPERLAEQGNPGDDSRYSDLCAQWKAAVAAFDSAPWAAIAGLTSIVSALAVCFALYLTHNSNRIASETARHQLIAYVGISKVMANVETGDIWVTFKNTGQTLARDFKITTRRPNDNEDFESPVDYIQPGQEIRIINDRIGENLPIAQLGFKPIIFVAFSYTDIYQKDRHVWHFTFFNPARRTSKSQKLQDIELSSSGAARYTTELIK